MSQLEWLDGYDVDELIALEGRYRIDSGDRRGLADHGLRDCRRPSWLPREAESNPWRLRPRRRLRHGFICPNVADGLRRSADTFLDVRDRRSIGTASAPWLAAEVVSTLTSAKMGACAESASSRSA